MSTVNAFGAWLPTGSAGAEVDLGIAARDKYMQGERLAGIVRDGLKRALGQSIERGLPESASHLLAAFVDSFPVAAMVDDAREIWTQGPDPVALAVLSRAARLVCLGEGLMPLAGGPWPRPPEDWVHHMVRGAEAVREEHPDDGARWVSELTGLRLVSGPGCVQPEVFRLPGEALAARRVEIVSALVAEEVSAVDLTSPLPTDVESLLAMGEVRLEARAQQALEVYGRCGLLVQDFVRFESLLGRAPPGLRGEFYRPICQVALLPGTPRGLARGDLQTTGWLAWEGPFVPIAVKPMAVELIRALDGRRGLEELSKKVELPPETVVKSLEALRELGAISSRGSDEMLRS